MSQYYEQALKFLRETDTTMEVVKAVPQSAPLWAKEGEKHGIKYSVTLSNPRHKYTFDFWNSIKNAEILDLAISEGTNNVTVRAFMRENHIHAYRQGTSITKAMVLEAIEKIIEPNAYDILACLSPLSEDTFDDFCSSMGYNTDSIQAEKTYRACIEQDRNLRKLFTLEQLEALQEIN